MSMVDRAADWFRAAIIVVIGFVIISAIISAYAKENPLFAYVIGGGGVLAAIIYAAKKIFY